MSYPVYTTRIGNKLVEDIDDEIHRAKLKHGEKKFNSIHEGFAILKEEVDELWDEIKKDAGNVRLREEAIQVAAMAIRFINELTNGKEIVIKSSYTPEQRFLDLIKGIDISHPVVDFEKYPNEIFWFNANGEFMFRYNFKKGIFGIRYSKIWVVLNDEFKMNHHEIVEFMKKMVEEHFKLKGITSASVESATIPGVEEHFKSKGILKINLKKDELSILEKELKNIMQ